MKISERFINYAKIDTQSDPKSTSIPSSEKQKDLGKILVEELKAMDLENVHMDTYGNVYGFLASNSDAEVDTVGFIAHMDTAPDFSGANVNPRIIENYDGKAIVLNQEKQIIMHPEEFENLKEHVSKTLIVGDGTSLLGADDKAGIAEIMDMLEYFYEHLEVKHGRVAVAFTCDEEIGRGADYFDVKKFGASYAYTVDGGDIRFVDYENFNAAQAVVNIQGSSVHPGDAKNKMLNACLIAHEYQALMPNVTPANTEMREGFIHLHTMQGRCEDAELEYILRDHDMDLFNQQKKTMENARDIINKRYGKPVVRVTISDQYLNMEPLLKDKMWIVDDVKTIMKDLGVEATSMPIRGGTDGSRLSYMGLPCPNIGTGGFNFHGKYEYVCVESMEFISKVLVEIIKRKVA